MEEDTMVQVGKVDILAPEIEEVNKAAERMLNNVRTRMLRLLDNMETLGERDMGFLCEANARKFHDATKLIREIADSLHLPAP
jgi:hypothetical protein